MAKKHAHTTHTHSYRASDICVRQSVVVRSGRDVCSVRASSSGTAYICIFYCITNSWFTPSIFQLSKCGCWWCFERCVWATPSQTTTNTKKNRFSFLSEKLAKYATYITPDPGVWVTLTLSLSLCLTRCAPNSNENERAFLGWSKRMRIFLLCVLGRIYFAIFFSLYFIIAWI